MSGEGAPKLSGLEASRLRIAVVAASWHETVMGGLVGGALDALKEMGIAEPELVRVPGSFELPVVTRQLARLGRDAVIALGVVIRGGTPHFEYVASAATNGLSRVALDTGVPVGFGLLTCDDEQQAIDRAGLAGSREDKGREAAEAAVVTLLTVRALRDH